MTLAADLDFTRLWFDLLFSTPLATPVRVDQWALLCVCAVVFLHRELGTEQSTCSLINQ